MAKAGGNLLNTYVADYVVFDLETTGISPKTDEVVEVSAVKVEHGKLMLSGGCIHTRTQTAQRILRRAASIMLRRLDAVRERLAESSALESLLTARNS